MKIYSTSQIYGADKATIENEQITSLDLMERAARICFDRIHEDLKNTPAKIHVFCGIGNNGGDGLVISRYLIQHYYNVHPYVVNFSNKKSPDFWENYERIKVMNVWPEMISSEEEFPEIEKGDIVIDAIFGIGISRSPSGWLKELIEHINSSKATVISIDTPSGMLIDTPTMDLDAVIKASVTYTFQCVKLPFLLPNTGVFTKKWEVVDIGLDREFLANQLATIHYIEQKDILKLYKKRSKFSHKGTYGHSLLIGGCYGKIGAVILASKSALKTGSGLVSAYVPACGYEIVQTAIPEIMVEVAEEKECINTFQWTSFPTVIGIGMGLGVDGKTIDGFREFLNKNELPLVLDADALNIMSKHKEMLQMLPENAILTPHPKEFERLVGEWNNDFEKLELLKTFSEEHKLIVVLKGAHTIVAHEGMLYVNSTGTPALATAGSGDVLTGMITGLMAQKYDPLKAAILGVYLHGKTANILEDEISKEAFTASDIIENINRVYLSLNKKDLTN